MDNHKAVAEKVVPIHEYSASKRLLILSLVTLLVGLGVFGAYQWQHHNVATLNAQAHSLQASIATARQQLAATNNQNNGVVATPVNVLRDEVNMLSGQVTFNMPSGWVAATASHYNQQCYIGGLAAQFCLAATTVVPKTLNTDSTSSTYGGITITVFKHSDNTTAAEWFASDFEDAGEYLPTGNQTSPLTINGYNAYYVNTGKEQLVYGDQFNNEYYAIANKSYVVLITSNVNNNAGPNGTTKVNDNSQYSPAVKTFANSIKMQGN